MDSWQVSSECTDIPLVRVADVLFTERMKKKLSEWRDGLLQNRDGGLQHQSHSDELKQQLQTVFFKMRPALSLTGFTSHQLKLIKMVNTFLFLLPSAKPVLIFPCPVHLIPCPLLLTLKEKKKTLV